MPIQQFERQVESRLREREVRYTEGRRAVVSALRNSDGPRSAAELYEQLHDRVPLSSIYRSLSVLEAAGILTPHFGTKGLSRYEIAEWLAGHHHHLVCVECGAVEDIEIPSDHEDRLRQLIDDLAAASSFHATDHSLEIEGRCSRCR
jgi:Fur family ferric uptake transcriptional regulator